MTNEKLTQLKSEVKAEITKNILPFWSTKMIDEANGGFYGRIDGEGIVYPAADKGCIMNARILWTFASAYRVLGTPEYLKSATRAKDYLLQNFVDKEYKGVYWLLDDKGNMTNGRKQIYAQAFAIYGLSEYYRAVKDEESLQNAIEIYTLIEKYSFDNKQLGYLEAFTREWSELEDNRLSERDANEKKTMNTHLHILEAYTNLYRVWKDEGLKKQLRLLINVFADKIVNHQSFHLNLFFDENWNCKSGIDSYGHDIEASWLLDEAARVLGDYTVTKKIQALCLKIANAACEGLMPDGSLIYEKINDTGHIDKDRHWWPNVEALIGFLNAYELSGDTAYLNKALASWRFIAANLIDKERGEWFWSVNENLQPNRKDDKAGFWKCPYHNGRMCLEVVERVK
jgi:mannobiose 2-epimerase